MLFRQLYNGVFMKDNKFKVFNQFNISQSPYMKGEDNFGDSLVDYTVHVPTLKEYLEEFVLTGHCSACQSSRYLEYEDDSEEFEVQDYRDADIDEIKEYQQELNEKIRDLEKKQKQKKSTVPENNVESRNDISNNEKQAPEIKEE